MNNPISIMFVGVGGQGTLLASKVLGNVLISKGFDVKVSEVHGMAQRGGSVVTYVRFGDKVHSPVVCEHGADFIVAFEKLEAFRMINHLKKDGKIIVNTQQISPIPVIIGACEYPIDIENKLLCITKNTILIDAFSIAKELGNPKVTNIILLGVLAKYISIPKDEFTTAIKNTVPKKFLDMNLDAFEKGYNI